MGRYDEGTYEPQSNTEGRYFKLYVTTVVGPKKSPTAVTASLIWFTAKGAAEYAAQQLELGGHHVTKLYRP